MTHLIQPGTNIPVRDARGKLLPVDMIRYYVSVAVDQARQSPDERWQVHPHGWGYPHKVIAKMFDHSPMNISLPYEFMF